MPPASNNLNVKNGKVKMPVQWIDTNNNRIYYPNGNVGIGTTNPQNNLSVVGTTSTTTLLADNINTSDVYFPEIDTKIWEEVAKQKHFADEKNKYDYSFITYKKK